MCNRSTLMGRLIAVKGHRKARPFAGPLLKNRGLRTQKIVQCKHPRNRLALGFGD